MTVEIDPALLTPAQRAALAAWPEFAAEAAIVGWDLDRLVRSLYRVASLSALDDEDAAELEALMRTATIRLRLVAASARGPSTAGSA